MKKHKNIWIIGCGDIGLRLTLFYDKNQQIQWNRLIYKIQLSKCELAFNQHQNT